MRHREIRFERQRRYPMRVSERDQRLVRMTLNPANPRAGALKALGMER
jgi:hypothetical protein